MATADTVVVELIAKTDGYEAKINGAASSSSSGFSKIEASASRAEASVQSSVDGMGNSVRRAANDIEQGSARAAQATRNLGFQLSDIGTSLGGGASPFIVFSQQAPQVIQALEDIKASGAGLGVVLSSVALPAGVALVSLLAPLAAGLLAGANGMDAEKNAADELAKSIHDLESATRSEISTGQRAIFVTAARANQDLVAVTAKRELIKAILSQRIAEAQQSFGDNTSAVLAGPGGAGAQAAYAQNIGDLQRQLAQQDQLVSTATGSVQRSLAKITQIRVQESLNPVLAATGKYERAVDLLNRRLEKGQISNADYAKSYGSLTVAKDAAVKAAQDEERATGRTARAHNSGAEAVREAAKAAREAAQAQKELEATLDEVTRKYDPATAALKDYYNTLQDIADLQSKGAISRGDAAVLGGAAMSAESKRRGDRQNAQFKDLFGSDDPMKDSVDGALKASQDRNAEAESSEQRIQKLREDNVKSLADIYEDAFNGNTSKIWERYKQEGLRALAVVLARATLTSFASGGGGFGSLLGNIGKGLGSIGLPKFASGGSFMIGGAGGVDRNTLSLNGQPIAAVSKGETLNIGTRAAAARGSGVTVMQTIHVDGRNSVTPAGFARDILTQARGYASQAGQTAYNQAVEAGPGRISQRDALGT